VEGVAPARARARCPIARRSGFGLVARALRRPEWRRLDLLRGPSAARPSGAVRASAAVISGRQVPRHPRHDLAEIECLGDDYLMTTS